MITNTLQEKIGEAMKAGDGVRVSTLRMLSSALNYEKIEKQHELKDEEELAVIAREVKKRKEAIESYEKAGATEKADLEKKELSVLEEFLPKQMDDAELEKEIDAAIQKLEAKEMSDMGKVIGFVKGKVGASAEGGKIAALVKEKLT